MTPRLGRRPHRTTGDYTAQPTDPQTQDQIDAALAPRQTPYPQASDDGRDLLVPISDTDPAGGDK